MQTKGNSLQGRGRKERQMGKFRNRKIFFFGRMTRIWGTREKGGGKLKKEKIKWESFIGIREAKIMGGLRA